MSCRVEGISQRRGVSEDPSVSIEGLARQGIDPESFHSENPDRFQGVGTCSPTQIQTYSRFQDLLGERISQMSASTIAETLERLYRQAYIFDSATGEMTLGTGAVPQQAKRELDLWIAAIDHRAFEDEPFFNRIWEEGRIRQVMALNSPQMRPKDRGAFERLARATAEGEHALSETLYQTSAEGYADLFAWLEGYDGRQPLYFEGSYWRSSMDFQAAAIARFGEERAVKMFLEVFPRHEVERLIQGQGLQGRYEELRSRTTEALVPLYTDLNAAPWLRPRPAVARKIAEEITLIEIVFHERGVNPTADLKKRAIEDAVRAGLNREDVSLQMEVESGANRYTADRLDDYRPRFGLLRQYRTLYRNILERPTAETFTPQQQVRYAQWGGLILNRSLSGVPILLADLDRIRWEEQARALPSADFAGPGFYDRDPTLPHWYLPYDLGACGGSFDGPLFFAGLLTEGEMDVEGLICRNVELLAFLPKEFHSPHTSATALGLFGIATVTNGGPGSDQEWTPGTLTSTIAHEASHIEWFRENFDRFPGRLLWTGINERRAYAVGLQTGELYQANGLAQPDEVQALASQATLFKDLIETANEVLGLDLGELAPLAWNDDWDLQEAASLGFQPPSLLQATQEEQALRGLGVREPSRGGIERLWHRSFVGANFLTLPNARDRREALRALSALQSSANTEEKALFYVRSHPLTQVVNLMRQSIGLPPLLLLAPTRSEWETFKTDWARQAFWFDARALLHQELQRVPPKNLGK